MAMQQSIIFIYFRIWYNVKLYIYAGPWSDMILQISLNFQNYILQIYYETLILLILAR